MLTKEKFDRYHAENPQIYEAFEKFTFQVINAGRKYFGAGAIFERMRWESAVSAINKPFKLCNSYRAFYARLFEERHPQYKDFFRKRNSIADMD